MAARVELKTVKFTNAQYLGGLPGSKPTTMSVTLFVTAEGIGVGSWGPKKGMVSWGEMAGVSFDTGTAKKSRAGAALAVGVFALAARKTQDEAHVTVTLKDGNAALYRVVGKSGLVVRGRIQPFLVANGVPCLDDGVPVVVAAGPLDQLKALGELHDAGVVTDEEFTAKKTSILARM